MSSFAEADTCERLNLEAARAMRAQIEQQPGGLASFRAGVNIVTLAPDDSRIEEFYKVLRSSILPDELVPVEDFLAALGTKNADVDFRLAFGPYRYFALAIVAPDHGIIGAAGFAAFCHHEGPATLHASYYALLPPFRGLGLVSLLLEAVATSAVRFIAEARPTALSAGPLIQFIEANDIATMTLTDRLLDQAIAMHPIARDAFWERVGFRELLDVNYRQRSDPPIDLALKALLIEVGRNSTQFPLVRTAAPVAVEGKIVSRHVAMFDSLLMNFDTIARALKARRPWPTPAEANLLANVDPDGLIHVRPIEQAAQARREWSQTEDRLRELADVPLGMTMQALREHHGMRAECGRQ